MTLDLRKNISGISSSDFDKKIALNEEIARLKKEIIELNGLLKKHKENSELQINKLEIKISEIGKANLIFKNRIRENDKLLNNYKKNEKIYLYNEKVYLKNEEEYEKIIKSQKLKEKRLQNTITSLKSELSQMSDEIKKIKKLKWYNKILGI